MPKINDYSIKPEEITWRMPPSTLAHAEIWHQLNKAKTDLEVILAGMSKTTEEPTEKLDSALSTAIYQVAKRLTYCRDYLR
jgi:hypothetical protein